jgi:hypothetical protein
MVIAAAEGRDNGSTGLARAAASVRFAQLTGDSLPVYRRRIPDPATVGLPDSARVNPMMFRGLKLSREQADSVVRLAEAFARVKDSAFAVLAPGTEREARWDGATRERMMPFIDEQTRAYRAVLTPLQQAVFDSTTSGIVAEWRRGDAPGGPARVKLAPAAPAGSGRRGLNRSRSGGGPSE